MVKSTKEMLGFWIDLWVGVECATAAVALVLLTLELLELGGIFLGRWSLLSLIGVSRIFSIINGSVAESKQLCNLLISLR